MIRWWRKRPAPTPEQRVARAEAMMRAAIEQLKQETGCEVLFQPAQTQQGAGFVTLRAACVCIPAEALRKEQAGAE